MYTEVIFDIETQKLFDQIEDPKRIADLKVSVVSAYRRKLNSRYQELEGEMMSFWTPEIGGERKRIVELWSWLEGADRIVGFNSVKFDAPVINPYLPGDIMRLPHFDILEQIKLIIGHRLSLGALAKSTLGEDKLADGLAAVDWWNAGDEESLSKLQQYCEMDVMVTKKIYDAGLKGDKLRYVSKWNEPKEFEVDWSYPKRESEQQLGLF